MIDVVISHGVGLDGYLGNKTLTLVSLPLYERAYNIAVCTLMVGPSGGKKKTEPNKKKLTMSSAGNNEACSIYSQPFASNKQNKKENNDKKWSGATVFCYVQKKTNNTHKAVRLNFTPLLLL